MIINIYITLKKVPTAAFATNASMEFTFSTINFVLTPPGCTLFDVTPWKLNSEFNIKELYSQNNNIIVELRVRIL